MKYFLIGLLCAGVVFLLVSAFLPSDYEIERELVIAAEPSELFEAVADLRSWPDWSAWRRDADPEAEWTIEGEPGPGQVMQWSGPELGAGRLEWVAAEAPRELVYVISMPDGSLSARGTIRFEPVQDAVRVHSSQTGGLDGTRMKWAGLFFDGWIGKQFELSLQGLRDVVAGEV